jgi:hypothetical protein
VKILLTATVTPQVTWDLHIQDPRVRRREYVESLRRWVSEASVLGATVVMIENSGEDLERLAVDALDEVPDSLRLVQAPPPSQADVDRGKGSAEAAMMDQFCETFYDDPAELWFKCTGRLFVRNLARCMPVALPPNPIIARVAMNLQQMDTRFFGSTTAIWRSHFTGAGVHVSDRDEVFLEKVLMRRVFTAMGGGANLVRFGAQPAFLGRSGTHADRVYDSPANRLKRLATNRLEDVLKGPLGRKHF